MGALVLINEAPFAVSALVKMQIVHGTPAVLGCMTELKLNGFQCYRHSTLASSHRSSHAEAGQCLGSVQFRSSLSGAGQTLMSIQSPTEAQSVL